MSLRAVSAAVLLGLAACSSVPRLPEARRQELGRSLVAAAIEGNFDRAAELLAAGADVNARKGEDGPPRRHVGEENWTALRAAAERKDLRLARLLLDAGADPRLDDGYGSTPLDFSMDARNPASEELALLLLSRGADPNSRVGIYIDDYGDGFATPLHAAAACGLPRVVRALLDRGAKVHAKTTGGWTPMHDAVSEPVARMLAEAGGDLDALDRSGFTPLARAVRLGRGAQAIALIRAGADVDASCGEGRLLHEAATSSYLNEEGTRMPEVLRLLVDRGARIDAENRDLRTPLELASEYQPAEFEEAALYLLAHGANPNPTEELRETPLLNAVMKDHLRLVRALLEKGAKATAKDANGWTSLHQACLTFRSPEIVRALVKAGADPNAKDSDGKTPLDVADEADRPKLLPLLRKE